MKKTLSLFVFYFRRELTAAMLWATGIALYNFFSVYLFRTYGTQTSIAEVYQSLPEFWRNILGKSYITVNSLEGWMVTQFFALLPIFLGVYTAIISSSLFAKEFENRSIEILLVQPLKRSDLFVSKTILIYIILILIIGVNLCVTFLTYKILGMENVSTEKIFLLFKASSLFMFMLASLSILISVFFDNQKLVVGIFLGITIGLFLMNSILVTLDALHGLQKLNPFYYFDGSVILTDISIDPAAISYWTIGGLVFFSVSLIYFIKRDVT